MSLYIVVRTPSIVDTGVQNILSICVFSIDCNPTLNTNVLVSLGNPEQAQNIDLYFTDGTPITFDELGTFKFPGVNPDTCATILGTFREPGNYQFNFALLEETTNAPIDQVSQTIRAIGESFGPSTPLQPEETSVRNQTSQSEQAPQLKVKQVQKSAAKKSKYKRPNIIRDPK